MALDLPKFYKLEGSIDKALEDCIKQEDEIYAVRVQIDREFPKGFTFFSRGDFREDALRKVRDIGDLPTEWEKPFLFSTEKDFLFHSEGTTIYIAAYDFKRLGWIVRDNITEEKLDVERNIIFDRESFRKKMAATYAQNLVYGNHSCKSGEVIQPPNDEELTDIMDEAGKLYDHYSSFPIGSVLVTEDGLHPFILGKKIYHDLRCKEMYLGHNKFGLFMITADPAVRFLRFSDGFFIPEKNGAIVQANFDPGMTVNLMTFADDEKETVKKMLDSFGQFKKIIGINLPKNFPTGVTPPQDRYWYPSKEELIKVVNKILDI